MIGLRQMLAHAFGWRSHFPGRNNGEAEFERYQQKADRVVDNANTIQSLIKPFTTRSDPLMALVEFQNNREILAKLGDEECPPKK